MFKGFEKRLKRDVQRLVDARLKESEELSKHKVGIGDHYFYRSY